MSQPVSFEVANELLRLEERTGLLFWRERDRQRFNSERSWKIWNTRYAGKEAFTASKAGGYRHGQILGKFYKSHRVVWLLYTGSWPKGQIDHIDGNTSNNRIDNLRDVSHSQNNRNRCMSSRCKSGQLGVTWCEQRQKWMACIRVSNRTINLGRYTDKGEAIAVRKAAEKEYGFHKNHGRIPT